MKSDTTIPTLQEDEWWKATLYGATYHLVRYNFRHQRAHCGVVAKHRKTKTPPPACICSKCLEHLRWLRPGKETR